METVVFTFIGIFFIKLIYEKISLEKARKKIKIVIHVNGIRGKSTVSRLIDAGLRDGKKRVFTKVTGTEPKYIDIDNQEKYIKRIGKANIREQIKTIKKAAKCKVEILILECMAVKPELQKISEEKIVRADIGVITNVRYDHLDEMGESLEEITNSLCNMVPQNGILVTGEKKNLDIIKEKAELRVTKVLSMGELKDEYKKIDFMENVAVALKVCECLGVDREIALKRMKKYKKDSGVLKEIKFLNSRGKKISFINLLAANDPDSSEKIIKNFESEELWDRKKYLMVNNRRDRLSRLEQFINFVEKHEKNFEKIFISGESTNIFYKKLSKNKNKIEILKNVEQFDIFNEDSVIFAVGNICGKGKELLKDIESRGIDE
ncbi:poly-gamma-glutamate synthase PgsB [Cetobacterium somerae]|uniref:poly-gamma-glutamate synthase PgsB n=1 Tax=Cetobacterium somerae TaxID=188913 RepID=UPI00224CEBB6|nr:poly-gamma-glutamate synthase PgsB [Cetobacterium somerae]MCX3066801.1 poly-gamma-glutamate synthase PgsB [Cetobacterium somerae]